VEGYTVGMDLVRIFWYHYHAYNQRYTTTISKSS